MKKAKFIVLFAVLLSFFGCEKKVDARPFEEDVLNSLFVEVVDSIYMDRRTMLPPPTPRIDFKTNKQDTTGFHKKLKEYWHNQDSIKNSTARILIGVTDLITKISPLETEIILKEINPSGYNYDTLKEAESFKFDLTPFKNNKKFDFQLLSKFPAVNLWDLNDTPNSLPVGAVGFSRIQFNKTKTKGILSASASCGGGKCGRGFLILIENKSGKWKIKKIIPTWLS